FPVGADPHTPPAAGTPPAPGGKTHQPQKPACSHSLQEIAAARRGQSLTPPGPHPMKRGAKVKAKRGVRSTPPEQWPAFGGVAKTLPGRQWFFPEPDRR